MARSKRGARSRGQVGEGGTAAPGSGGLLGQVGLFETANGLPHGPAAIALAIVAALVIYPITRLVRFVTRRSPSRH
jgi:hypothetical protein